MPSLATVKKNLTLAYGETAMVGRQICEAVEHELAIHDRELAELRADIADLQNRAGQEQSA